MSNCQLYGVQIQMHDTSATTFKYMSLNCTRKRIPNNFIPKFSIQETNFDSWNDSSNKECQIL